MKSSTLQPFNAAVVAIACTLLVLELEAPDTGKLSDLAQQWETFLAHYNSFCLIYLLWYMHAREIERVDRVSPEVVLLNGFWLILLTIIPFATNWVEIFPDKAFPQLLMLATFSFCYLINNWIIDIMIKNNPDVKFSSRADLKDRIIVYILLIVALINSFIFPVLNIIILFFITLFFIYWIIKNRKSDLRI